jgi:hypothetical protein
MADPNRNSIPIVDFVIQLLREKHPNMDLSRGSANYQQLVLPVATILQPFRDRSNTVKRNQSMLNYQLMDDDEMDRKAANFFVERGLGGRAFGSQRVFFSEVQSVFIDESALFLDDEDRRWRPVVPVTLSAAEMGANVVTETGEYFVDVSVVSEVDGEEYRAEEGQVNRVVNVAGAVRTTNLSDYFSGNDPQTNTELFITIAQAITNRDLVKADAIITAIKANFTTVRDVIPIGMGDSEMTRDVVEAIISIDQVLRYSFARKINLPLDENGEVKWTDDDGNPIISPLGGYVAAVEDLTGVDFNNVIISTAPDTSIRISVQPGFRVRMYEGYGGDPDAGDYSVTRVEEVPIIPGGPDVKVLRLDRPFGDPQIASWDPDTDFDKYSYTIFGGASARAFHIGGKIDAYIDSTADEEDYVIVNTLPEIAPGVSEIPVTDVNPINPSTNLPLFENNKAFRLPVINIVRLEQVDSEDDLKVERDLVPDANWTFVLAEARGKFTLTEDDLLIIKGFEEDGTTAAFTGRRIKIYFTTNQDIPLIQDWVDLPNNKDLGKDLLIIPKKSAVVDTEFSFSGPLELAEVQDIVSQYIRSKGFAGTVSVHEIDALLAVFGVTDVTHPMDLRLRRDVGNGTMEFGRSQDSLTANDNEVFSPASPLSITKV